MSYRPPKWLPLLGLLATCSCLAAISSFQGDWQKDLPALAGAGFISSVCLTIMWRNRPNKKMA